MHSWLNLRSSLLDEIVSLDGPGDNRLDLCNSCSNHPSGSLYRCLECYYSSLQCSNCIVESHKTSPLHRLEVGSFLLVYENIIKLTLRPALAVWVLR